MEKLYQYLWKSRMFGKKLRECDGADIEVIDPGRLNHDAGPDFFNSKIRVGGTEWVGNIEIHVKASDWKRHGHDSDPAYDNIILHVVAISDARISRSDGTLIPQVQITLPEDFYLTFNTLSAEISDIRCASRLAELPSLVVADWLESLSVERLQKKAARVADIYRATGNDWEQTCFISLARALGFSLNGDPFELLAKSIPLKYLHHHSDNELQLQALLFGQAAMLDSSQHIFDEYYQLLCREYYFLARKYGLRPMRPGLWKYSRTRPQNFPHRRIAMLAAACHGGFSLFSEIISSNSAESLRKIFSWELKGYWSEHLSFDTPARQAPATLSASSVTLLIINAVVPVIYAFASMRGDEDKAEAALDILASLPAENNTRIRQWEALGLPARDALRSQALLHLRNEYCDARKCLYCRFGNHLLRRAASPTAKPQSLRLT